MTLFTSIKSSIRSIFRALKKVCAGKTKFWFLSLVLVTVLFLLLFLIPLNFSPYWRLDEGEGFGLYNLLVDIVVGSFTVWALFWAASQFAEAQIKPDLYLIIGRESNDQTGVDPIRSQNEALIGRDDFIDALPVSQVIIGLFLENAKPKTATFVRLTLRVANVPNPIHFEPIENSFKYHFNRNTAKVGR